MYDLAIHLVTDRQSGAAGLTTDRRKYISLFFPTLCANQRSNCTFLWCGIIITIMIKMMIHRICHKLTVEIKFYSLFSKRKILDASKLKKKIADDNFKFNGNGRKFSKWEENTVGKGVIAHYDHFLLFQQCFQDLNCRHVKTRACLGKS